MIIRSKIPTLLYLVSTLYLMSCSTISDIKNRVIKSNEKQIASKLRLGIENTRAKKSENVNDFYIEKTKHWFTTIPIGQKIYIYDINNDNHLDLIFLKEKYSSPVVFEFDPLNKKYRKTNIQFFNVGHRSSFLIFDDFNKDGVTDFYDGQFFLNVEYSVPPSRIFKGTLNREEKFKFETNLFPIKSPHSSGLVFDLNNDGEVEFLQTFWMDNFNKTTTFYPPKILSYSGIEVEILSNENQILQKGAPSWSAEICDIDNNDILDILIANTSGHENFVLKGVARDGHHFFESAHSAYTSLIKDNIGQSQLLGNGNSFGYICADFDNDGLLDVLSYEEKRQLQDFNRDPIRIHFQRPVTDKDYPFLTKAFPLESKNYSIKRVIEYDMDNDGDLDLLLEDTGYPPRSKLLLFENQNGEFKNISSDSGVNISNPAGVNVFDVDLDGQLDIIVGKSLIRSREQDENVRLFSPKIETQNKSVKFYLRGFKSNSSAQGAIINFVSGDRQLKHIVNYTRGGASGQRARAIHFGTGNNSTFKIEVKWPHRDLKKIVYKGDIPVNKKNATFTLCEDGKILIGNVLCLN